MDMNNMDARFLNANILKNILTQWQYITPFLNSYDVIVYDFPNGRKPFEIQRSETDRLETLAHQWDCLDLWDSKNFLNNNVLQWEVLGKTVPTELSFQKLKLR